MPLGIKKERKHHCSALVRNHPTVIMKDLKSNLCVVNVFNNFVKETLNLKAI